MSNATLLARLPASAMSTIFYYMPVRPFIQELKDTCSRVCALCQFAFNSLSAGYMKVELTPLDEALPQWVWFCSKCIGTPSVGHWLGFEFELNRALNFGWASYHADATHGTHRHSMLRILAEKRKAMFKEVLNIRTVSSMCLVTADATYRDWFLTALPPVFPCFNWQDWSWVRYTTSSGWLFPSECFYFPPSRTPRVPRVVVERWFGDNPSHWPVWVAERCRGFQ